MCGAGGSPVHHARYITTKLLTHIESQVAGATVHQRKEIGTLWLDAPANIREFVPARIMVVVDMKLVVTIGFSRGLTANTNNMEVKAQGGKNRDYFSTLLHPILDYKKPE